jgi:hypothetical protein
MWEAGIANKFERLARSTGMDHPARFALRCVCLGAASSEGILHGNFQRNPSRLSGVAEFDGNFGCREVGIMPFAASSRNPKSLMREVKKGFF